MTHNTCAHAKPKIEQCFDLEPSEELLSQIFSNPQAKEKGIITRFVSFVKSFISSNKIQDDL